MTVPHRTRFVLLAVTAVVLIVAAVLELRGGGGGAGDEVRGHLGPTPGPSSEGYIRAKRAYLEGIAGTEPQVRSAALVSYETYVPAPSVQQMLRGMEATAVWVRFPEAEAAPVLVETTVAGAVADAAAAHRSLLDAEVGELEDQVRTATGEKKAALEKLLSRQRTSLAKVTADCGCVYAVSVEDARIGALRDLLDVDVIKHVDVPDPVTNDLTGWELQPFVPVSR